MAEFSKIQWTTHTFNPWIGCTKVSEGCHNCYAENLMDLRYHRVEWGKGNPRSKTKTWKDPVRWNKQAEGARERPRVFCASLADYLDSEVPQTWRKELFGLIEQCSNLDWLLLTKRIENARDMLPAAWLRDPPPHVWYGVTAENQRWLDKRLPILERLPAAIRFISYEPALGPLDLTKAEAIDWVIIGGESAQSFPARRFELEWARNLIVQCQDKGIAAFIKQVGSNGYYKDGKLEVRDAHGGSPEDWPKFARVREFPGLRRVFA